MSVVLGRQSQWKVPEQEGHVHEEPSCHAQPPLQPPQLMTHAFTQYPAFEPHTCPWWATQQEPTEHELAVYEPLSTPFEHVRVCAVQLPPHATEDAAYAVMLAPCATVPPKGDGHCDGGGGGGGEGAGDGDGGGGVGGGEGIADSKALRRPCRVCTSAVRDCTRAANLSVVAEWISQVDDSRGDDAVLSRTSLQSPAGSVNLTSPPFPSMFTAVAAARAQEPNRHRDAASA